MPVVVLLVGERHACTAAAAAARCGFGRRLVVALVVAAQLELERGARLVEELQGRDGHRRLGEGEQLRVRWRGRPAGSRRPAELLQQASQDGRVELVQLQPPDPRRARADIAQPAESEGARHVVDQPEWRRGEHRRRNCDQLALFEQLRRQLGFAAERLDQHTQLLDREVAQHQLPGRRWRRRWGVGVALDRHGRRIVEADLGARATCATTTATASAATVGGSIALCALVGHGVVAHRVEQIVELLEDAVVGHVTQRIDLAHVVTRRRRRRLVAYGRRVEAHAAVVVLPIVIAAAVLVPVPALAALPVLVLV